MACRGCIRFAFGAFSEIGGNKISLETAFHLDNFLDGSDCPGRHLNVWRTHRLPSDKNICRLSAPLPITEIDVIDKISFLTTYISSEKGHV